MTHIECPYCGNRQINRFISTGSFRHQCSNDKCAETFIIDVDQELKTATYTTDDLKIKMEVE